MIEAGVKLLIQGKMARISLGKTSSMEDYSVSFFIGWMDVLEDVIVVHENIDLTSPTVIVPYSSINIIQVLKNNVVENLHETTNSVIKTWATEQPTEDVPAE